MATLTIRNLRPSVVKSLKSLARKKGHSMEREIRDLLEEYVAERASVLAQIQAAWAEQVRRPSAKEVDEWIVAGRD